MKGNEHAAITKLAGENKALSQCMASSFVARLVLPPIFNVLLNQCTYGGSLK